MSRTGDGTVQLRLAGTGEPLALIPEYAETRPQVGLLQAVALPGIDKRPVSIGAHTPRILVGGTVFQRERWDLPPPGQPAPADRPASSGVFLAAWRWKERWGMPDAVFVRVPGEPKPFAVDFCSPDSVEVFLRAADGADRVGVEELLPRPDQLWLRIDGQPHCCELRLTAVRLLQDVDRSQGGHGVL
ncbi:MAG TPA: lantibiotic dehydratase [Mycobacteriales bacterium]|nr:lantibiotic dehydratase [Mycobacteriales bacterium]